MSETKVDEKETVEQHEPQPMSPMQELRMAMAFQERAEGLLGQFRPRIPEAAHVLESVDAVQRSARRRVDDAAEALCRANGENDG